MAPIPDARLTCISHFPIATYSGMLPGTMAGLYHADRMKIDLVRLCAAAGARFIVGNVAGLDRRNRTLLFDGRPPLPFDFLSIGIGSVPKGRFQSDWDETTIAVKPMQTFLDRFDHRLTCLRTAKSDRSFQIIVIGAGVGGLEISLAISRRVKQVLGAANMRVMIVDRHDSFQPFPAERANRLAISELEKNGIRLELGKEVTNVSDGRVRFADGSDLAADVAVLATSARASPLFENMELAKDDDGFLLTHSTLQCVNDERIFAVGDSGTMATNPTPKAGVYAVRQGPVLWSNLNRAVRGESLTAYAPQRGFLRLASTGDGRAILTYRSMSTVGRWCWQLKDVIDSRFMRKYQNYKPMEIDRAERPATAPAMRCAGCGSKVGSRVLQNVIKRLEIPAADHVVLGLDAADDAAIVRIAENGHVAVTTDFFTAPLNDLFLVGRIAALNAMSDTFAMGARPTTALALVTIPLGPAEKQEAELFEVLRGAVDELERHQVALVGGHTTEGPHLALGFTILADPPKTPRTKAMLRAGDQLVLTKLLGTGILLAAQMRAMLAADWYMPLLGSMLASNGDAAQTFDEFDIQGVTDVTGFGLAGHLWEMLSASGVSARLKLASIPLLPGVEKLTSAGIQSTLAPANRLAEENIRWERPSEEIFAADADHRLAARYAALFDPQTSGGLLMGVPAQHVAALQERLSPQKGCAVTRVGEVLPAEAEPAILLE